MEEFLRNILTRRNWFLGTVAVAFVIYFLVNPNAVAQIVNGLWQLIQLVAGIAFAIVGIRIILGYKPWWLGGGSSAKKKGG